MPAATTDRISCLARTACSAWSRFDAPFTGVRADHNPALATCRAHGFEVIGTARRHAKIDGRYMDEFLIEKALDGAVK
jgi:hypothetical protein